MPKRISEEEAEKRTHDVLVLLAFDRGIMKGKHALLIQMLKAKFGGLSPAIENRIRSVYLDSELDQLAVRILTANSLDEMGLNGSN